MKVKLIGSIAIVTSRAQVEGTSDGVAVKGIYRYTRVYQHLPTGGWKITSFEATRVGLNGRRSHLRTDPKRNKSRTPATGMAQGSSDNLHGRRF